MGIDYSFDVYVHRRDAGRLLAAVAALCDTSHGERRTTVALPDGTTVDLPATYGFKAGRTVELAEVVAGRDRSSFDMVLCFPQDDVLRRYRDDSTDVDVTSATSGQSRVFLASPAVRQTFATVALSVGAPLCLLDVEERFDIVVTVSDQPVSIEIPVRACCGTRGRPRMRRTRNY
ncbi:hypothetical protein GCM10009682_34210 [Luedemannella flava]|uniref:Uncharacterized protein n=1 Tax=Luedemannella flava TaxID=349316 RepID=A0ABP4YBC2_9ACTN